MMEREQDEADAAPEDIPATDATETIEKGADEESGDR
jgi:hypothetical protein